MINIVNRAGRTGFSPRLSHTKTQKWKLTSLCLTISIIWYISTVSRALKEKEQCLSLRLFIVGIQKGAFGLPSTRANQLTVYLIGRECCTIFFIKIIGKKLKTQ